MKNDLVIVVVLAITGFLLINQVFKEGFLVAQDNPPHLAEAYFLIEGLIPKGKLTGWANIESAGFPIFIFNYPVGYWLISIAHYLFGLSVQASYKLLIFVAYLAPALLVFLISKNLFGRIPALIAAILMLFQFDFLSFILAGLWGQYLGLIFAISYIYLLLKHWVNIGLHHSIAFAILIALSFLSHPFTTAFLAYTTLIFLTIKLVSRGKIKKLFLILAIGWVIGLAILPWKLFLDSSILLENYDDTTSENLYALAFKSAGYLFLPHLRSEEIKSQVGWEEGRTTLEGVLGRFDRLLNLSLLNIAEVILSILAIMGIVHFITRKRKSFELTFFLISFVVLTIIASGLLKSFPLYQLPVVGSLFQFPRYFVYARIMMVFFAAYSIAIVGGRYLKNLKSQTEYGIVLLLVFYLILLASFLQVQEFLNIKTSSEIIGLSDVDKIWVWIKENVNPNESRVFYQNTYGNFVYKDLGNSHIFALSTYNTGVESLGTWQGGFPTLSKILYSGNGQLFGSTVSEIEISHLAEMLRLFNAKYIVTSEGQLEDRLLSSNLFERKISYGDFSIFSLTGYQPTWIRVDGRDVATEILKNEIEKKKFKFRIENGKVLVTVKVTYHPYWRVLLDGKEIEISKSGSRFIEFATEGEGDRILELIYAS